MSKVFIEETTLSAIGDAIRGKTGKTELIAPLSMATEISSITTGGGGGIEVEPIVLTGDCQYTCSGTIAGSYIKLFGNTITTKDINNLTYMFRRYSNPTVPFEINCAATRNVAATSMFQESSIEQLPKINNFTPNSLASTFDSCYNLAYIPEDYFDNWDFEYLDNLTSSYTGNVAYMFEYCYSLRKIPKEILKHGNKYISSVSYTIFYQLATNCHSLDELIDIPFIYTENNYTSSMFSNTVAGTARLKDFTFEMPNGNSIVAKMKSQTMNLSECGYCKSTSIKQRIIDSPTNGITNEDYVGDDATYQALKDTNNWFTDKLEYSRYNRISAVNTINSLPDTSAYLASAGGTNTIKFKGTAGSATDGGAINTLTEEEIAVATAKGWTVTFA